MAFNWIVAFKVIPWADVIAAAPTVAKSARELWRTLKKPKTDAGASVSDADAGQTAARLPLEEQVRTLRFELAETRAQLVSTSEVLQTLAEQDEKLIAAIEVLRVRTRILLYGCVALALVCAVLLLR